MFDAKPSDKTIADLFALASSGTDEDERRQNAALFIEAIEEMVDQKITASYFFPPDVIVAHSAPMARDVVNPDLKCVCFRCDKELDNISDRSLQPNDGLAFVTTGHYGTTFFDPMDGSKLEIVVCDECLRNHFKVQSL